MITPQDIDTLARTIYGEARGEDAEGRRLVAEVILNRFWTGYRRKRTITDVCLDPWQFSCWNANDPNREKLLRVDYTDTALRGCMIAAMEALGPGSVLPRNTRHYYATSMPKAPFWAAGHKPVAEHGHHRFYAGVA